jgi:hypothetical protein
MTDYVKSTNFAAKDALALGNPLKIVKGTEIDEEFNNIAIAVTTKANSISPTLTGVPLAPTAAYGTNTTQLATTAFVQAAVSILYPVGSIYTNASVATNPGTLLGFGTWTAFGAGRVLVGLNASNALFDTAEETGGSADAITVSHTHAIAITSAEAGTHQHSLQFAASSADDGPQSSGGTRTDGSGTVTTMNGNHLALSAGAHTHSISGDTVAAGSSGTNANLQPYITVYMWKRTA